MRNFNILVVAGQNRSVIWRDDAGVNTISVDHITDAAVGKVQGRHAIFVFHVGVDAVELYRKLFEITVAGLLGDGRLLGVSGVAGDVEVDGSGALGHSPAVAVVDKLDSFGAAFVFGERVGAVLGGIGISSHISAGIDGNGAGVALRRVDNVSDAKAAREQIEGLCIVLGISVGASYRYGVCQQTGVARHVGVDVEIVIARLLRRGVDNDFNDIVLYQRNGYIAAIVASGDVYLYVLAISCGCKHGDAPHFFMRNVSVGVYFVASNYTTVVNVVIRVARRLPTIGEIIRVGRLIVGSVDLNTNRIKDYVANPILGIILRVILLNDAVEEYIVSIHHVELCSADA